MPVVELEESQIRIQRRWRDGDGGLAIVVCILAALTGLSDLALGWIPLADDPVEQWLGQLFRFNWLATMPLALAIFHGTTMVRLGSFGWERTFKTLGVSWAKQISVDEIAGVGAAEAIGSPQKIKAVRITTRSGQYLPVTTVALGAERSAEVLVQAQALLAAVAVDGPDRSPAPPGWRARKTNDGIAVEESWRTPGRIWPGIFSVLWISGGVVGLVTAQSFDDTMNVLVALLVASPAAYIGLRRALNRQTWSLDSTGLRYDGGLIPTPAFLRGDQIKALGALDRNEIVKFDLSEVLRRKTVRWFTPVVRTRDGRSITLRGASRWPQGGRYLVEQLNRELRESSPPSEW